MTACWVLCSRLTYFWRNMNISSIFYFSKSTLINTQNSGLWDTRKMMLFRKCLVKWKGIGRISWKCWYLFKILDRIRYKKDRCYTWPILFSTIVSWCFSYVSDTLVYSGHLNSVHPLYCWRFNVSRGVLNLGFGRDVPPQNLKADSYKCQFFKKKWPIFIYQSVQFWSKFCAKITQFF